MNDEYSWKMIYLHGAELLKSLNFLNDTRDFFEFNF